MRLQYFEAVRLSMVVAHELYKAYLVGEPTPHQRAMLHRMRNPQPGDLVVESSALARYLRGADFEDGIGRFVRSQRVRVPLENGEHKDEDQVVVEKANGIEQSWSNCEWLAIPDRPGWAGTTTWPSVIEDLRGPFEQSSEGGKS